MLWRTYGRVIGWMLAVGAIAGAVFLLVVFGLLIPVDRGEESAIVIMPFVGGFFGLITALVSSATYYLGLFVGTRRPHRSVSSRAWLGAACAALGALGFWLIFGFTLCSWPGVPVWGGIGAAAGILAALIAGPLTAQAAKREKLEPEPAGASA